MFARTLHSTLLLMIASCVLVSNPTWGQMADTIFHNGQIITVDKQHPEAEAVAVKDGKFLAVGDRADVMTHQAPSTTVVDLNGKTLVPGFIDGHSHFFNSLQVANQANCYSPPAGPVKNIADVIQAIRDLQKRLDAKPGEFLLAYGYDPDTLEERRHITAADLDPHFPDNPVIVQHVSLHGAVLNSLAMKAYNITAETKTPPGGVIARIQGSSEPAGLLMETAYIPIFAKLPTPGMQQSLKDLRAGQLHYAAAGITTAQEGATHQIQLDVLEQGAKEGLLFIDVVAYPFITEYDSIIKTNPPETFGKYNNRLKLGGVKITCDGSPQGLTAFFSTPYLKGGPNGEANWRGEPTFPQQELNQFVRVIYGNDLQLIAHCNGDAAIDMLLAAHEQATGPERTKDRRTTIIHSQFVRPDQLQKYSQYKLNASFYTEHCFFFAETHLENRGRKQTEFLSPMRTALDMGIHCTNHTDFNVAPIDQLFVMWSAVNRTSRKGEVIGAGQRITPLEALRALTLDGAWQYGEEDHKGSIEVGKLADLVILSDNPLTVAPQKIKDIQVLETFKEGTTIFKKDQTSMTEQLLGDWTLIAIHDTPIAKSNQAPALRFGPDGMLTGSTGINRLNGRWSDDGEKLFPQPFAMTRRAGPPEAMKLENEFVMLLDTIGGYSIEGDRLTLAGTNTSLQFRRSD